jgi:outer membrane protein assembly factor BamB
MRTLLILTIATLSATTAGAQEWPRFRGPNGNGFADARLPASWSEKDYLWKVALPGQGHSSPVLWDKRIFVTSAERGTGRRLVLCLAAEDGRTLWTRDFTDSAYKMHQRNSSATSTPAVDADHVYVAWATPEQYLVLALDHAGQTVWQKDLGPYKSQHGFGVSPVVFEDIVVVADEADGDGALVALDRRTGAVRWQVPRHGKNATYSTPCVFQPAGRPAELIFTNWQHGITAVEPRTGKVTWEISVFEPSKPERAIASPVVAGDLVLGTCGFVTAQKHLVAVRPEAGGKVKEVWRVEKAVAYLPTPLVLGERIFLCSERGVVSWLEAATGKVLWQERLDGEYSASPVCAGTNIYCIANDGDVTVLAASDKYHFLARNRLGAPTQSTPALAGGRMYLRTASHLICVGQ